MKYCIKCVLPDTRPQLVIREDGVCNACHNSHKKEIKIDWSLREKAFNEIVKKHSSNKPSYDCIIPVSGGKDSTWQVVKCLEYGLKPLAVTWKSPARNQIGQMNLDNLVRLGVDHIDYQISPSIEKKFMYLALKKYGSTAIPMHMAIHSIPLMIASNFNIPLIVWGENSAFEYGSENEQFEGTLLDSKWREKFGVTHGTSAMDWVNEELSLKDLTPYFGPSDKELESKGIKAIFLGQFFNWDVEESLRVAKKNGFQSLDKPKVGYYNYTDIDDDFISIHHFIKWYKFGFTRLFDNLSLEIRNRRMTREEAILIIKKTGIQQPDEDISKLCQFLEISRDHFYDILETFRNKKIWNFENNAWRIKNFLIDDWRWN
jgi:N-acetyl sugar amidotransferase